MAPHLKPLLLPQLVAERQLSPTASPLATSVSPSASSASTTAPETYSRDSLDAFEFDSYPLSSSVSTASNLSHSVPSSFHQRQLPLFLTDLDSASVSHTRNSSASDLAPPATPPLTMASRMPSHARNTSAPYPAEHGPYPSAYAPLNSVTSTMIIDFTQSMHLPMEPLPSQPLSKPSSKRLLPDVMEEPYEREERLRSSYASSASGSYQNYCLGTSCSNPASCQDCGPTVPVVYDIDYESVMNDNEYGSTRKLRDTKDGTVSGISSRFPTMAGWKSARSQRWQPQLSSSSAEFPPTNYPVANSSQGSFITTPPRPAFHRMGSSTSGSPATSFCDSHESVLMAPNHSAPAANVASKSIEKDRSQALTPLLPPLMVDGLNKPRYAQSPFQSPFQSPIHSPLQSSPQSPLQSPPTSPSIDDHFQSTVKHHSVAPSHRSGNSLSTRPSISSFLPSPTTEMPPLFANIMQEQGQDQWSDSLGHANFTITPAPYQPETATQQSLQKFRDDWQLARADYVKHILRTGENYGETSKVYQLTEEKWEFIQGEWCKNHSELMKQMKAASSSVSNHPAVSVGASPSAQSITSKYSLSKTRTRSKDGMRTGLRSDNGSFFSPKPIAATVPTLSPKSSGGFVNNTKNFSTKDATSGGQWRQLEGTISTVIPHLVDGTGKFPYRGDEDIVGPMVRDAVMIRNHGDERKAGHFSFFRSFLDKIKK
ncbi:hypothetical protein BROUX41_003261 [Berkeleyomyces rouxiae]|uniref:uncharacterized protein n=1 Tax=Berkeleyomyces rouxiae TaxID=2035830 RepID=UPI003B81AF04